MLSQGGLQAGEWESARLLNLKDLSRGWIVKRLGKDSEKGEKRVEGSWENRDWSTERGKALGGRTGPQQRQWLADRHGL